MSTLASERISNVREKEKSKLQDKNGQETFILHDGKQVNNEILIAN